MTLPRYVAMCDYFRLFCYMDIYNRLLFFRWGWREREGGTFVLLIPAYYLGCVCSLFSLSPSLLILFFPTASQS